MRFRTVLLGLAALFIAFNAAYFSVTGLSKLFAGASMAVIIMASSLEFAKIIAAGFLYNYWDKINKALRSYLLVGVFVLILITSLGIYGFLTSAYQDTSDQLNVITKQTEMIDVKKTRYVEQLDTYTVEKLQLTGTINELSKGLANNVIQYKDKETGKIITTTSRNTRRSLETQLEQSKEQRDEISGKMDIINDSITSLELKNLDVQASSDLTADIGPLKYLSKITGKDMDIIVNWFTLFIVFVFDPLAITLIVAFSTAIKVDRDEKDKKKISEDRLLYGETPEDKTIVKDDDNDWESLRNTGLDDKLTPENAPEWFESKLDDIEVTDEEVVSPSIPENKDLNNDGIITPEEERRHYETTGWKNAYQGKSYFLHPWFDWKKQERWIRDSDAVRYWMSNMGGTEAALQSYRSKYPTNFNTKTY